jgi:beta-galactosidase
MILLAALCAFGFAQRTEKIINGNWAFTFTGSDAAEGSQSAGLDESTWQNVNLPHCWNASDTQDGILNNYARGFGWYRKHFTLDKDNAGKRVYVYFESAAYKAQVYCNGTFIGRHLGGYASFCFDITESVKFGEENLLAVRVDNADTSSESDLRIIPLSGDFNKYGGLCRGVRLIITEPVHITPLDYASPGVYLTASNVSEKGADLEIKTLVRNTGSGMQNVTIRTQVFDAAGKIVKKLKSTQVIDPGTEPVLQTAHINKPHLWNGRKAPYLYSVTVELSLFNRPVDMVRQPLGLRYYSVDKDKGFFLNGEHYDLVGVAMHEDRFGKGRAISDADREQDMNLMLEMGCTWIRPSHYQHGEKFYDLADESGMVLSSEIPIVNGALFSEEFIENCESQLTELIRQNYNHPSILFWIIYNELTTAGSETIIDRLNKLVKAEDPARITSCAHSNASDHSPWSKVTDTLAYNRYMGWYGKSPDDFAPWADKIHSERPEDCVGITEYGAGANAFQHQIPPVYPGPYAEFHPEEYQLYYHEKYWLAMKARPFLWCKTVWCGFDFAVDNRDEGSQIELNDKGMVTRDRKIKKDIFYWYKANWNSEPMVYITSRRAQKQRTIPPYIKVYSNCESVELFVNGASCGVRKNADNIFLWEGELGLKDGENEIKAVAAGNLEDSIVWDMDIMPVYVPVSVSASKYEGSNTPIKAIDGSWDTRFSADDYPSITFDLGEPKPLASLALAFYRGTSRVYQFSVDVSDDMTSWKTVLESAKSSGKTEVLEEFAITPASARYIRVTSEGNSSDTPQWMSLYEAAFYGEK